MVLRFSATLVSHFALALAEKDNPRRVLERRFFILDIPPDVSPIFVSCEEDIGFQYSMEIYFTEFLLWQPSWRTYDWRVADFIWLPQCVSKVYWHIKEELNLEHEAALAKADIEYLWPVVEWARHHPAHARFHGANFFTVLSMDLGRQDFPASLPATMNWTIGALTGQADWLQTANIWVDVLHGMERRGSEPVVDRCAEETRSTAEGRQAQEQDFVINIPSRFLQSKRKLQEARARDRPRLVFFAGSLNSCARRLVHSLFGGLDDAEVMIKGETLPSEEEYREAMLSSKYCLVLRGSSHTNNVRLSDVMAHGCIPVIISDDFHPPLEGHVPWEDAAVFLRTADVPWLLELLRALPVERRETYLETLTAGLAPVALMMDYASADHWTRNFDVAAGKMQASQRKMRTEWTLAAQELKVVSQDLYAIFLESVQCPHRICMTQQFSSASFGCAGAESLWPALAAVRSRSRRTWARPWPDGEVAPNAGEALPRLLVVDVGAGQGRLSVSAMAELELEMLPSLELESCRVEQPTSKQDQVLVISVESTSERLRVLEELAAQRRWAEAGWKAIVARLAEVEDEPGGAPVVSLPELREQHFPDQGVFLLRLHGESSQFSALLEAEAMLQAREIRFIVFEYWEPRWKRLTLWHAMHFMFSLGYLCFLVTSYDLFLLSGVLWDDAFAQAAWSNVLCADVEDESLVPLLGSYCTAASRAQNVVKQFQKLYGYA